MPVNTPTVKVVNTRRHGAEVILTGETVEEAAAFALAHGRDKGLTFIHPYDDPLVIAGQGTLALEMLGAAPEIDTLLVPIGGGGLISGIAVAAKALKPSIRLIGVQAALYPSMYNAIKGESLPMRGDTLAEGIAVKAPGQITQQIVRRLVDDIVLVSEQEIERAVSLLINIEKTVVEGAGAAGLAAVLRARAVQGAILGLVLCGGNIDTRLLASVLTREFAREGRLSQLAIDLVDRPGTLGKVANILGEAGANIVEVYHQRVFCDLPAKGALLEAVIETRDRQHLQETVDRLKAAGFEVEVRSNPEGPADGRCAHAAAAGGHNARHAAPARAQGALAVELHDPPCQPRGRSRRRPEGGRAPGLLGLARHADDGALFPHPAPRGSGGRQAACQPGVPRHPVPARQPEPRQAAEFPRLRGVQSYPSRTKDTADVDFSTGSVGLGIAETGFASLVQDYVHAKGWSPNWPKGRMVGIMGDAEIDEGNVHEALLEYWKHGLRELLVDHRLQPPEPRLGGLRSPVHEDGGPVREPRLEGRALKYGKLLQRAFGEPGGQRLKQWIDDCPNMLYSALVFQGGEAWRRQLEHDLAIHPDTLDIVRRHDDAALARLMTNLGGHDLQAILEAFETVPTDQPVCFIAYTIKGYGLPFQGHKDNHSGLMTKAQMSELRAREGINQGEEWDKLAGLELPAAEVEQFLADVPFVPRARGGCGRRGCRPTRSPRSSQGPDVDASGLRPRARRDRACRRSAGRAHRHHLARRDRLHQPGAVGQPARSLLHVEP